MLHAKEEKATKHEKQSDSIIYIVKTVILMKIVQIREKIAFNFFRETAIRFGKK